MTTTPATTPESGLAATAAPSVSPRRKGSIVVAWITSTDHKTIGYMYMIASFVFFILGGIMALAIRAELFEPGMLPWISTTPKSGRGNTSPATPLPQTYSGQRTSDPEASGTPSPTNKPLA